MTLRTTYNDILNQLKTDFFNRSGEHVENFSDLGARFQAVASELFSLSCYAEFLLKQAFAQTATGEYLNFHAALRDIQRKKAAKAYGELTFYLNKAAEENITIPPKTVCAHKEKPYLQFETVEEGVIEAGQLSVTVKAQATECGKESNVLNNIITVMVNPPSGVARVCNCFPFIGGYDEENDIALRKRVTSSYRLPQTGFSTASLEELVMKIDEVIDCNVIFKEEKFFICVRTLSDYLNDDLYLEIATTFEMAYMLGYSCDISLANSHKLGIHVEVTADRSDFDAVTEEIKRAASEYFSALRIGEGIDLMKLAFQFSRIDGVKYCEITIPQRKNGIVTCPTNEYFEMGTVEVTCHE